MVLHQAKLGNDVIPSIRTFPKPPMGWPRSGNANPADEASQRGKQGRYGNGTYLDQSGRECKANNRPRA